MPGPKNRAFVLASRPSGLPVPGNFRLVERPVPVPRQGEALLRTLWLSLDPYMRGRMDDGESYDEPVAVGDVMTGGTVSLVEVSQSPDLAAGDIVVGYTGWQEYAISDGRGLRKVDPASAPVSTALGIMGMPGMTAYTGLLNIGRPQAGETLVVAAATGAVGSAVGQIGRIMGCRVVGIAGGPEKARYLTDELGFDAGLDRRAPDFGLLLRAACPRGIDIYFENVGGGVWDAVYPLLNDFARVPVCGLIAQYNDSGAYPGPDRLPGLMMDILVKRFTLRGFIVDDFGDQLGEFIRDMGGWMRAGRMKYREDVADGLENAPEAFIGMLQGRNFGKMLVRVSGL